MNNYTGEASAVNQWYANQRRQYDAAFLNGYKKAVFEIRNIITEISNRDLGLCDTQFVLDVINAQITKQMKT